MSRRAIVLCLVFSVGCSREPVSDFVVTESDAEVVEGGTVKNADREKCSEYFSAIANVQSAEEEEQLFREFGDWLTKNGYQVMVEAKNGKHILSCPYFPPVTPWAEHSCLDVKNLELLPQNTGF